MRKKAADGSTAGPSEATRATLKGGSMKMDPDDMGGSGDLFEDDYKLQTVNTGEDEDDLFGDDEGGGRKRKDRLGYEGDPDEVDYDSDASDDEEKQEADGDDEMVKEIEVRFCLSTCTEVLIALQDRLKREYRQANKMVDGHVDEDPGFEEDMDALTGAGKDLKKLVKRTEKNEAYESDDEDKNPYVSVSNISFLHLL